MLFSVIDKDDDKKANADDVSQILPRIAMAASDSLSIIEQFGDKFGNVDEDQFKAFIS